MGSSTASASIVTVVEDTLEELAAATQGDPTSSRVVINAMMLKSSPILAGHTGRWMLAAPCGMLIRIKLHLLGSRVNSHAATRTS
jgi:hypothetical protein